MAGKAKGLVAVFNGHPVAQAVSTMAAAISVGKAVFDTGLVQKGAAQTWGLAVGGYRRVTGRLRNGAEGPPANEDDTPPAGSPPIADVGYTTAQQNLAQAQAGINAINQAAAGGASQGQLDEMGRSMLGVTAQQQHNAAIRNGTMGPGVGPGGVPRGGPGMPGGGFAPNHPGWQQAHGSPEWNRANYQHMMNRPGPFMGQIEHHPHWNQAHYLPLPSAPGFYDPSIYSAPPPVRVIHRHRRPVQQPGGTVIVEDQAATPVVDPTAIVDLSVVSDDEADGGDELDTSGRRIVRAGGGRVATVAPTMDPTAWALAQGWTPPVVDTGRGATGGSARGSAAAMLGGRARSRGVYGGSSFASGVDYGYDPTVWPIDPTLFVQGIFTPEGLPYYLPSAIPEAEAINTGCAGGCKSTQKPCGPCARSAMRISGAPVAQWVALGEARPAAPPHGESAGGWYLEVGLSPAEFVALNDQTTHGPATIRCWVVDTASPNGAWRLCTQAAYDALQAEHPAVPGMPQHGRRIWRWWQRMLHKADTTQPTGQAPQAVTPRAQSAANIVEALRASTMDRIERLKKMLDGAAPDLKAAMQAKIDKLTSQHAVMSASQHALTSPTPPTPATQALQEQLIQLSQTAPEQLPLLYEKIHDDVVATVAPTPAAAPRPVVASPGPGAWQPPQGGARQAPPPPVVPPPMGSAAPPQALLTSTPGGPSPAHPDHPDHEPGDHPHPDGWKPMSDPDDDAPQTTNYDPWRAPGNALGDMLEDDNAISSTDGANVEGLREALDLAGASEDTALLQQYGANWDDAVDPNAITTGCQVGCPTY